MSIKFVLIHDEDKELTDTAIFKYIGCFPNLAKQSIDATIYHHQMSVDHQENPFSISFFNIMNSSMDEDEFLFIFDLKEINPSVVNESLSKVFSAVCGDDFNELYILEWKHDLIKTVISWDADKGALNSRIHSATLNTDSLHYKNFSSFVHTLSKPKLYLV